MSPRLIFGQDPPPSRKATATVVVPVVQAKPDTPRRAGTTLTPGAKRSIYGPGQYGKRLKEHGVLDEALRLYQTGGESGNFIYRRLNMVTLDLSVWRKVDGRCETLEWVDHTRNVCYRLTTWAARYYGGHRYDAGIGERVGWPVTWCQITDASGTVLQEPAYPPR